MSKKVLLVIAHPSSNSFSHTMAKRYESKALSLGLEVRVLDLYRDELGMTFVNFQNPAELKTNPQSEYFREFLAWADEYVFFFPVWWFDSPAILKNFFDGGFTSGFAYKHGGAKGVGLLTNKVAKIYTTADGPAWTYYLGIVPTISIWKWRLTYCGVKVKKTYVLGEKRWQSHDKCEKWMEKCIDRMVAV